MLSISINIGGTTDEMGNLDLKQVKSEVYKMSWVNDDDSVMFNLAVQDPPPPIDLTVAMRDYLDEDGNPLPEPRKSN